MRRFPALFVIVLAAVACTVVGVWAVPAGQAGASHQSTPPLPVPAPPLTIDVVELSSQVSVAPIASAPAASAAATVAPPVTAPVVAGPPAHLVDDALATPSPSEAAAIVATTTAAPTTTTAAPQATVTFTASQQYGSCGEDVPYDVFSGTATPGSTVTVSSPYGSGTTTADGSGHWTRTVEFPTAPRGETFAVTAAGLGGSSTLFFTATGSPAHS